jgi:hypothetical protein
VWGWLQDAELTDADIKFNHLEYIRRDLEVISPVEPSLVIQAGDILFFSGAAGHQPSRVIAWGDEHFLSAGSPLRTWSELQTLPCSSRSKA